MVIFGLYGGFMGVMLGSYWGFVKAILGLYWGYVGTMESWKKLMETTR